MDIRELLIILLVAAAGVGFVWFETGRDPRLLKAAAALLGMFALIGGAVAVAVA